MWEVERSKIKIYNSIRSNPEFIFVWAFFPVEQHKKPYKSCFLKANKEWAFLELIVSTKCFSHYETASTNEACLHPLIFSLHLLKVSRINPQKWWNLFENERVLVGNRNGGGVVLKLIDSFFSFYVPNIKALRFYRFFPLLHIHDLVQKKVKKL